jgi:hypothetical protein
MQIATIHTPLFRYGRPKPATPRGGSLHRERSNRLDGTRKAIRDRGAGDDNLPYVF